MKNNIKITEETYIEMKKLISEYEKQTKKSTISSETDEPPYIMDISVDKNLKYNPKYGDDRICKCGHAYYRHFDTYEDMYNVGCKYCKCNEFKEAKIK